ncbi:MAG: hypothetical protein AAB909_01045 [Patescibacteria group bacterium]
MIDSQILNYLERNSLCVFTVIQEDGSLHSATCKYASTQAAEIIIHTKNTTRKVQNLLDGKSANASVVVGVTDQEWISWQATGTARVALKREADMQDLYERRYSVGFPIDSDSVFIIFSPIWYRYTEFKSDPKVIIESQ